ncbi:MAG TPA: chlorite dismutase family protein [Candidatus Limnocylindrales bacterium]|nr:chlorite dismutase family protein [Candidatus Limnocylindrales bacterium]
MTDQSVFVQALGLALDPAWRRRGEPERTGDARALLDAEARTAAAGVRTLTCSTIGLEPGVEVMLLRLAPSVDALEESGARLHRDGLGAWLTVRHSFIGRVAPSQYVKKATDQERSLLDGEPKRYLVVYPFTKAADWYLLGREARQGIMNEHMRVGHAFPQVRQLLAYSFGLDDQDFVVAYDTDDLDAFGDLVRELRGTESRRSTVTDRPLLLGVRRSWPEILAALGAPPVAAPA